MDKEKKTIRTKKKHILLKMPDYVYDRVKQEADDRMESITYYILKSIARRLEQEK